MARSVTKEEGWMGHDEVWDSEWDDFAQLVDEFRHRRATTATTALVVAASSANEGGSGVKVQNRGSKPRCPSRDYLVYPSVYLGQAADEEDEDEDDLDYVQTMVCHACIKI